MIKVSLSKRHPLLVCPISRKPLMLGQDGLFSSDKRYPLIDGAPWIYKNGENALAHWNKKIQDVFDYNAQKKMQLENSLALPNLLATTKTRLEALAKGLEKQSKYLTSLLSSFIKKVETEEIVSLDRVPKQQSALSYHSTFFRDWVWGKDQVREYANLLVKHLKGKKRLAFPGAGACGLPLLIHNEIKPDISLAMDINPILLAPVQRLIKGETISQIEIPLVPTQPDNVAIEHEIKLDEKVLPGFEIVYCDAQNMPVQDQSLDGVVTSWFIDIVPMDFAQLAKNVNASLCKDGVWTNIGQLGFEKNDLSKSYGPAEIREILELSGFEVTVFEQYQLPYLKSPYSAVGRIDSVWMFVAKKKSHMENARQDSTYWPEWLLNLEAPIPLDESARQFKVRSAVYSFVMEQVDGQKSLKDVAQALSETFGLDFAEAEKSVLNFFSNYYEGYIYREF